MKDLPEIIQAELIEKMKEKIDYRLNEDSRSLVNNEIDSEKIKKEGFA